MNLEEHLDSLVPLLRTLKRDPSAGVFYDVMSGALVWTDEKLFERLSSEQMGCLRGIFHYRTSLLKGAPEGRYEALWNRLKARYPDWIGFSASRCTPSRELLALYAELTTGRRGGP